MAHKPLPRNRRENMHHFFWGGRMLFTPTIGWWQYAANSRNSRKGNMFVSIETLWNQYKCQNGFVIIFEVLKTLPVFRSMTGAQGSNVWSGTTTFIGGGTLILGDSSRTIEATDINDQIKMMLGIAALLLPKWRQITTKTQNPTDWRGKIKT